MLGGCVCMCVGVCARTNVHLCMHRYKFHSLSGISTQLHKIFKFRLAELRSTAFYSCINSRPGPSEPYPKCRLELVSLSDVEVCISRYSCDSLIVKGLINSPAQVCRKFHLRSSANAKGICTAP